MKIVCYGDSVTRGITFIRGRLRIIKDNYPSILQKMMSTKSETECEVINKGVFNDNSNLLLKRLDKDVLSAHPDYVLIQIGGNDCNFHWEEVQDHPDEDHESLVPLTQYKNNLKEMIERIKAEGAAPVLLTLLPLDPARYYKHLTLGYTNSIADWIGRSGGIEHWHGMYNRAINQIIESMDVLSIDLRTAFKGKGDFSALINDDGIHPSPKGYSAMAEIIMNGLKDMGLTGGRRSVEVHRM